MKHEPAFPRPIQYNSDGSLRYEACNEGMALRDYFAARAMQGLLAGDTKSHDGKDLDLNQKENKENLAHSAYLIADAMLAQRSL